MHKNREAKGEIQVPEQEPIRAIIDGLLYDTSKAEKKFSFISEDPVKNMMYYQWTTLYVTKSGRYFCEQCGNIIPLSKHELRYLLKYFPKTYQEIFGKVKDA